MSNILPRILVDFQRRKKDPKERISLPTQAQPELFDILRPDLRVILYEPSDIEVEAVVFFEEEDYRAPHGWWAYPDWTTLKDYDEATGQYLPSDRLSNR